MPKLLTNSEYKRLKEIESSVDVVCKQAELINSLSYLTDIQRVGRKNLFLFKRGEEIYQIETMGLISDNLLEWKNNLLR